jgi:hypothetical protein
MLLSRSSEFDETALMRFSYGLNKWRVAGMIVTAKEQLQRNESRKKFRKSFIFMPALLAFVEWTWSWGQR